MLSLSYPSIALGGLEEVLTEQKLYTEAKLGKELLRHRLGSRRPHRGLCHILKGDAKSSSRSLTGGEEKGKTSQERSCGEEARL